MKALPDIDRLKATLDEYRPLDPAIVRNLRQDLIVRWTYHSNAIEGTTQYQRERESLSRTGGAARSGTEQGGVTPAGSAPCEIFHKEDCAMRTLCDNLDNKPATPLEEAHHGGCFIFRGCCG